MQLRNHPACSLKLAGTPPNLGGELERAEHRCTVVRIWTKCFEAKMLKTISTRLFIATLFLGLAHGAWAQTADEVIEKHLAALGGRSALEKLKSRSIKGTITATTPAGDVSGPIETLNQAPNKSRTYVQLDLTAVGFGKIVQDQRFDGTSGYAIDSLQGNRDITGDPLEALKNATF